MSGRNGNLIELAGTFERVFRVFEDDGRRTLVGCVRLVEGPPGPPTTIKGRDDQGELIPGIEYRFYGRWESYYDKRRGQSTKQFWFQQFIKSEPHSRHGLVNYLARYAPGIGPALASRLHDAFGSDACKVLRCDPKRASEAVKGLGRKAADEASEALAGLVAMEETKIDLTNLFAGRGFPMALVDEVVAKWGVLAPRRVKRDPFSLLVEGFTGCGFDRCKRLYNDLGCNPDRLKVQMICVWHAIREDMQGHTWLAYANIARHVGQHISGTAVNVDKALTMGVRSGWLTRRMVDGKWWVADARKAKNEELVAERLVELMNGSTAQHGLD